jgi:hypothetical protein
MRVFCLQESGNKISVFVDIMGDYVPSDRKRTPAN